MTTIESAIQTVPANIETIYGTLSDLRNLEKVKDKLPADKINELAFDKDTCSFCIDPVGKVSIRVIDREPFKTIKFGSDQSAIPFNQWIQLVPVSDEETKLKVTLKADVPAMIKMMFGKKLQEFVDRFAETLAKIPY